MWLLREKYRVSVVAMRTAQRTSFLQALLKPMQSHDYNEDIDKSEVGENGDEVYVELLVRLEVLDINPVVVSKPQQEKRTTYVLSPDSVDALAPKK